MIALNFDDFALYSQSNYRELSAAVNEATGDVPFSRGVNTRVPQADGCECTPTGDFAAAQTTCVVSSHVGAPAAPSGSKRRERCTEL